MKKETFLNFYIICLVVALAACTWSFGTPFDAMVVLTGAICSTVFLKVRDYIKKQKK